MTYRIWVWLSLLLLFACSPAAPAATDSRQNAQAPANAPVSAEQTATMAMVNMNWAYPANTPQYRHLFIGQAKGVFASEGINLELVQVVAGNSAMAQGVVSNTYPLASIGGDVPIIAIERGAPLTVVSGELRKAMAIGHSPCRIATATDVPPTL